MKSIIRRAVLPLLALLLLPAAALAQAGWEVYVNARFGYRVEFPAYLFGPIVEAENGDGVTLTGEDGARLLIFGGVNAVGQSAEEIAAGLATDSDIGAVSYRRVTEDWIVLSGHLRPELGGAIFYERIAFGIGGEAMSGFRLEYPERARGDFDGTIERIGNSLTPPRRY